MSHPALYGLVQSVYTRIARLVFEEKSIAYELVEVDIFTDEGVPPYYLELHPFGRIPCLVDSDFVLYETSAITRYIDDAYPGRSLQPKDVALRAKMNQVVSMLNSYTYRPMIWDVFVERIVKPLENEASNEKMISQALPVIETGLQELSNSLQERQFLVSDNLTLADLHAAPMLSYFSQTPEGSRMMSKFPVLPEWMDRMHKRDSFKRTRSIYD